MSNNCPVHSRFLQHTYDATQFESPFCQCSASSQPVQQSASTELSTEGLIYTQQQPHLPTPSPPIDWQDTSTAPAIIMVNRAWQCTICPESFYRRQERERHRLTHVPYFLHCPLPHCAWRGNRCNLFKRHWQQEDHRSYHEQYGHTPEQGQVMTYDPWVILNQLINGAISLSEAEEQAIVLVQVKAYELQKPSMGRDPWGRKRHSMTQGEAPGQAQAGL